MVLDCVEVPKTQIFRGSAPGPRWGGLQRPPDPPAVLLASCARSLLASLGLALRASFGSFGPTLKTETQSSLG